MRLNKKHEYSILLALYLSRSGQANLKDVSANLNLSLTFLEQISRQMRIGGILTAKKGHHGGYSLVGDPTILQILKSVGFDTVLKDVDKNRLKVSSAVEHRSLGLFVEYTNNVLHKVLKLPISSLNKGLVEREMSILDTVSDDTVIV